MKRAILEDISAKQRFNLGELIIKEGIIKLGRRDCEYVKDNTISLGIDVDESDDSAIVRVSGRHATITYDPKTDTYLVIDTLSKNGTELERGRRKIPVTSITPVPMKDGDFVIFGGYKTLYSQKETEKRKDDGTRVSVFE